MAATSCELVVRCFTPFSFGVLHPFRSAFYTLFVRCFTPLVKNARLPLNVKHHRFEQQLQSVLAQRHGLGELLLAIVGSPPKSGRYARDDAASSLLGRALPRRGGPTLPRRDDVPLTLRNVPAGERSAQSSGKFGRSWRNFPAWERCGCARSRLGRSGKKGWPVYLRERQRPSPPKRAILSQGGTLWRRRADFALQRPGFSQAGTMRRECRAKSLLGRALYQPAKSALPRRVDVSLPLHNFSAWEDLTALRRKWGYFDATSRLWREAGAQDRGLGGHCQVQTRKPRQASLLAGVLALSYVA